MKKFTLSILAVLVFSLLLSVSAMAATNRSDAVNVGAVKGTAKIDGVIDDGEWDYAQELTITLDNDPIVTKYGQYQGGWETTRNTSDYSASMKFMWDEDALYILDKRVDDYLELGGNPETPWGGSDSNLLFIQTVDSGAAGNEKGYSHHVFYILGDGNGKIGGASAVRINDQSATTQNTVKYNEISVKTAQTADGWLAEVRVPWSVFAKEISGFTPAVDAQIGFSMVPIDFDKDGEFAQLSWFKYEDGIKGGYDYGGWATMTLQAAPEIPAPAADATADAGIVVAAVVMACAAAVVLSKKR